MVRLARASPPSRRRRRARGCAALDALDFGGSSARSGVLGVLLPCAHLDSRPPGTGVDVARASVAGPGFRLRSLAVGTQRPGRASLAASRRADVLAGAPLRASWRHFRTRFSSFLKREHVVDRYFESGVRAARAHPRPRPAHGGVSFLASGRSAGHTRRFPRGTLVAALASGQSSSNSRDHRHSTDGRHPRAQSSKCTFRARDAHLPLPLPSRPSSTSGCRFRSPR